MKLANLLGGPADFQEPLLWLQRKEIYNGELKANRLRMIGLAIFAVNELINYHWLHVVDKRFHTGSLLLIALWFVAACIFGILLRYHFIPKRAPYLVASVDILLLTWFLFFADGPKSPLVGVYFLIVALSGIRLNPIVTLFTSGSAVVGYLAVLEFTKRQRPEFLVPVFHAVIVIICLLLMGVIIAHLTSRVLSLLSEQMKKSSSARHG